MSKAISGKIVDVKTSMLAGYVSVTRNMCVIVPKLSMSDSN
jgi:hypothetical protein